MRDKLSTLQKVGVAFITIGVILGCISFAIPPKGVIDPSVIRWFGEILAGVGLLCAWDTIKDAIRRGIDTKVKHNGTEIEVHNPDNKEE